LVFSEQEINLDIDGPPGFGSMMTKEEILEGEGTFNKF
jgi:hypothetical protein